METKLAQYSAKIIECRSGDDLILFVNLGVDRLYKKVRVRLHGVDTPDAYRKSQKEEAGKVRTFVQNLTLDKQCTIYVHSTKAGSWVVTLYIDGECLNDILKEKGYIYKKVAA